MNRLIDGWPDLSIFRKVCFKCVSSSLSAGVYVIALYIISITQALHKLSTSILKKHVIIVIVMNALCLSCIRTCNNTDKHITKPARNYATKQK